jgi:Cytochrome P450
MYCAGADTVSNTFYDIRVIYFMLRFKTWSTLSSFFLSMVLHPECQVRAQEEIEAVIGSERLPMFEDRSSLPYVESILQETLRYVFHSPLKIPSLNLFHDMAHDMSDGTLPSH